MLFETYQQLPSGGVLPWCWPRLPVVPLYRSNYRTTSHTAIKGVEGGVEAAADKTAAIKTIDEALANRQLKQQGEATEKEATEKAEEGGGSCRGSSRGIDQ